jgi:hypothetical protein
VQRFVLAFALLFSELGVTCCQNLGSELTLHFQYNWPRHSHRLLHMAKKYFILPHMKNCHTSDVAVAWLDFLVRIREVWS